jgi:hypothetical protein
VAFDRDGIVVRARRALPHHLLGFVDLETRLLEVLDHPIGKHLARIVRRVFLEDPAQQLPAARDREADREGELVAERAVIHGGRCVLVLFLPSDRPVDWGLSSGRISARLAKRPSPLGLGETDGLSSMLCKPVHVLLP